MKMKPTFEVEEEEEKPRKVYVWGDPMPECLKYHHMMDGDWPNHEAEIKAQGPKRAAEIAENMKKWEEKEKE